MDMVVQGSVSASSLLWERSASWVLTVVCKVMFDLVPGEARLRSTPEPPAEHDVPWEAPYAWSLRVAKDLVPVKPNVDVVLTGHAYAPGGRPTRSLVARLAVGSLDKSVEVVADRYFDPAGVFREGSPFTHMPLVYERAAGGPGTWNTAGVRVGQRDAHGNTLLPNLVVPGTQVLSPERLFLAPVGFGPIPAEWPSRVEKLGRRSPRDLPPTWDGQSVPDDIGRDYFNMAPPDQQIATLHEDETITLENLHASHPTLTCRLPGVRPKVTLEVRGAPATIPVRVDTLHIDTDRGTCTLIWRGYMPLRDRRDAGRVVVALDALDALAPPERRPTSVGTERASDPTSLVESPTSGTPFRRAVTLMTYESASSLPSMGNSGLPFAPHEGGPSSNRRLPPSNSANLEAQESPRGGPIDHGLPFTTGVRSADPLVGAVGDTPPPVSGAPAWLQSRMGAPSTVVAPSVPPPAASWSFTPDVAVVPPAPRSTPRQEPSSPWALGPPTPPAVLSPAVPVQVPVPVIAGRGGEALPNSASAASDAAADVQGRPAAPPPAKSLPAIAALAPEKASRAMGEVLELLWYDEAQVPRMRAWWEELVTDLDFEASDPRRDLGAEDPEKARGRHNVFGILSDGEVLTPASLPRVINAAVNDRGRFTPPLTLLGGELRFPFDEVETLRATILAATPLVGSDKRLKESIDSMSELLKTPYLQGSTGVVEKLTRDLRDQFRDVNRGLPAGYLDGHVERLLLEQRRYAIRKVFGGEFIRALLVPSTPEGSASSTVAAVPVYLPKHLDQSLPMMITMKVRLIAEAHLQQDLYETSPHALRAVALGRSFQLDGRRG